MILLHFGLEEGYPRETAGSRDLFVLVVYVSDYWLCVSLCNIIVLPFLENLI